ncbi:MAG: hypothetical protein RLZZ519_3219, partial [Bacteroidota bacterium]
PFLDAAQDLIDQNVVANEKGCVETQTQRLDQEVGIDRIAHCQVAHPIVKIDDQDGNPGGNAQQEQQAIFTDQTQSATGIGCISNWLRPHWSSAVTEFAN